MSHAKTEFCRRLGNSWEELADALDIRQHDRNRFPPGDEARKIYNWLDERACVRKLIPALKQINREDLIEIAEALAAEEQVRGQSTRPFGLPRSVQHFEIIAFPSEDDLLTYQQIIAEIIDAINDITFPDTAYRFVIQTWDTASKRAYNRRLASGINALAASNDTVIALVRRNPSAEATEKLRDLLDADRMRVFVVIINNGDAVTTGTEEDPLQAMMEEYHERAHWFEPKPPGERAILLTLGAILNLISLEISTSNPGQPASYAETRKI